MKFADSGICMVVYDNFRQYWFSGLSFSEKDPFKIRFRFLSLHNLESLSFFLSGASAVDSDPFGSSQKTRKQNVRSIICQRSSKFGIDYK